jgi:hypothetical protein
VTDMDGFPYAEDEDRIRLTVEAGNKMIAFAREITKSPAEAILGLLIAARSICEGLPTDTPFDEFYLQVCGLPLAVRTMGGGPPS